MAEYVGVSISQIEALEHQGLSSAQIAEALNVTVQTVYYHKNTYGKGSIHRKIQEYLPWKNLPLKYRKTKQYNLAHRHLEYVISGGRQMPEYKLEQLRSWYQMFREHDVVLEFDPDIPGRPGLKAGGWNYVRRETKDNDLIIRVNKHTQMTDELYDIWRLPAKLPGA